MKAEHQKILDSVLTQVRHHGWTDIAFTEGTQKLNLSQAKVDILFPHGIDDVVDAFHQWIDDEMKIHIKNKRNFSALRIRDKITFAVRARLIIIEPHREAMRRLLLWSLMPRHISASSKHLWRSADRIWVTAGDMSTDYNYYTKRLLLIAVMKATLSFWLNDASPACVETWAFLDRRISDVMKMAKGISVANTVGIKDMVSFVRARIAA